MHVSGHFRACRQAADHAPFVSAADSPHNRLPSPAASGESSAAQEQKQINDLTGEFELCICNKCDQRKGGTLSPHGDGMSASSR